MTQCLQVKYIRRNLSCVAPIFLLSAANLESVLKVTAIVEPSFY